MEEWAAPTLGDFATMTTFQQSGPKNGSIAINPRSRAARGLYSQAHESASSITFFQKRSLFGLRNCAATIRMKINWVVSQNHETSEV